MNEEEWDHYHAGWGSQEDFEREEVVTFSTYAEAKSWCMEERLYEVSEADPLGSWDFEPYWVRGCNEKQNECQKKSRGLIDSVVHDTEFDGVWIAGKYFPRAKDTDKAVFTLTWDKQGRVTIDVSG